MKFLNREAAPISQEMWGMIDENLMALLAKRLLLRSVVDFEEGYDFTTDAVATGNLRTVSESGGVRIGVREPILMAEVRHDFSIPKTTLEAMKRDIEDFDDTPMREAANAFGSAENGMILEGLEALGTPGILGALTQKTLQATGAKELMVSAAKSLGMFNGEFVDGPFKILVSSATFAQLAVEAEAGETMKQKLENIFGAGALVITDAVGDDKALVISQRGGDFVFYSGLDVHVGFESESADALNFFLIESGAFRVINPEAAVRIDLG
jgi:uncharacterized linocin/CFP29 family protein